MACDTMKETHQQKGKDMNLLFVIDDAYVEQLKVVLYSIVQQMPKQAFQVFLMQQVLLKKQSEIKRFVENLGMTYHPIVVGEDTFASAPTTDRYPQTIYYRLLAHEFLPEEVDKVLYLDADLICLNGFGELYEMEMGEQYYVAASHNEDGKLLNYINKLRLKNFEMDSSYFNTGVLLMNLEAIRSHVKREDILNFIKNNRNRLILPDQDVLNGLYADKVIPIPDEVYNYDARYSLIYQIKSQGKWNLNWVIDQTVFLHFAGRDKPWNQNYLGRYSALYKFMSSLTRKFEETLS